MSDNASGRWPVRLEIAIPVAWASATVAALLVTLSSLNHDDFDGLNNIYQIPLALPWFLLPTAAVLSHTQDAWVAAGEGLLNALLVHFWLRRQRTAGG